MNKGEKIYYNIQVQGQKNIESAANQIIEYLEYHIGNIGFPIGMSAINKLYIILENGYYPTIQKVMDEFDYDYIVELQYILMNIAYGEANMGVDSLRNNLTRFPSLNDMTEDTNGYFLDTSVGQIYFEPLTRYTKDSKIKNFALQYNTHGLCHVASLEFIKANPDYNAVTSLIANQFGEKHYHSYIETPSGYADFANNIHMEKEQFDRIMRPVVLNKVNGFDLSAQEKHLSEEDLPENKTLLLRLAVHNQIKKFN